MESQPIKYSDLIEDDGAIQEAISQLTMLQDTYIDLHKTVQDYAASTKTSLQTVSGATEEGRKTTKKAAEDTSRLAKAQTELAFALSDVGKQVAELKMATTEANKQTQLEAQYVRSKSQSYNEFKAELTNLTAQYKAMNKEQALNSAEGQALIAKIIALKNSIKTLDEALKAQRITLQQNSAAQQQATKVLTEQEKAEKRLAQARSADNMALIDLMIQTKEANTVAKLNVIVTNEQAGSYNALSAQYALNKIQLNKMSAAEREETESGKALVKQTHEIYMEMIRLQEVTGKHTLSVGNYRKVWDGLGHSVGQVVREMPAMAINMNTLFLALSNNIPILVDEINMLKDRNLAAAAAGEKTVSVYKRIMSAMFSWNTVIVLLLTVLSMYGNQIVKFIGDLFKTEKAILKLSEAAKNYHEAVVAGREGAQQDLVRLRLLYTASQDLTKSIKYRTGAINEMRKLYPGYLQSMSDEQILAGEAANTYAILTMNILKAAKARAAEDKIVENEKEIMRLNDLIIGYKALSILEEKKPKVIIGAYDDTGFAAKEAGKAADAVTEYGKKAAETAAQVAILTANNKRLAGSIDYTDLKLTKEKPTKAAKEETDRTEEILRANLEIQKKYAEAVTKLNEDELVKQGEAAKDAYAADSAALMNKYYNDADLTQESRNMILDIVVMWGMDLEKVTADIQDKITMRTLQKQAETLQLMLEATTEGTYAEADARLAILENSRQQELLTNKGKIDAERQSEADINLKWDNIIGTERRNAAYKIGMEMFDLRQDLQKSEFDLLRTSENDKTRFQLAQQRERYIKLLSYAKTGALLLSDVEIKTYENIIAKLTKDIEGVGNKNFNIYEMLGLNLSGEEQQAIEDTINITMSHVKEALAAQVELAEVAIKKAEERVDVRQSALDSEIEARNNGYAFNVTQAQKELDLEKATLEKALKQKEKAVKAQQGLDSVMQASSLLTASAQIWSSLSGIPVVGYALAIAAIAGMWGSFAMSKVKANEVTKAQGTQYGEGGFELLQGGSHASGNDIGIGHTKDGGERRAEGGEGLAIISKNKMRKYGNLIPEIINSINRGIFETKYSNSFNVDGVNVISNGPSLNKLERGVQAIIQQGEVKRMIIGNKEVVYYKNLKTTFV